jgi:lysozyme
MKRVYVFGTLAVGLAAGLFFLSQGTDFDLSTVIQVWLSYFRRGVEKLTATSKELTGQSDAYSKALSLIVEFEGFSAKAYPDADGYSIGYGHFIRKGDPYDSSSVIPESEGYALLEQDARASQTCVANAVKVSLTDNQTAALISLTYNIGCGAFRGSTLLRKLNEGDADGAALEFARWNKSSGQIIQALVERRASEAEVFSA